MMLPAFLVYASVSFERVHNKAMLYSYQSELTNSCNIRVQYFINYFTQKMVRLCGSSLSSTFHPALTQRW